MKFSIFTQNIYDTIHNLVKITNLNTKSKEMVKHQNHLFAIGRSKNMKTILINRHTQINIKLL